LSPLRITSLLVALAVSAMVAVVPVGLPADAGIGKAAWAAGGEPALLAHAGRLDTRLARHEGRVPAPPPFAPPPALLSSRVLAPPPPAAFARAAIAALHPASAALAQPKTCRGPPRVVAL
jgi:hypothetical protein